MGMLYISRDADLLLYCSDSTQPVSRREIADWTQNGVFREKQSMIVSTKCDAAECEYESDIQQVHRELAGPSSVFRCSALTGEGVSEVLSASIERALFTVHEGWLVSTHNTFPKCVRSAVWAFICGCWCGTSTLPPLPMELIVCILEQCVFREPRTKISRLFKTSRS